MPSARPAGAIRRAKREGTTRGVRRAGARSGQGFQKAVGERVPPAVAKLERRQPLQLRALDGADKPRRLFLERDLRPRRQGEPGFEGEVVHLVEREVEEQRASVVEHGGAAQKLARAAVAKDAEVGQVPVSVADERVEHHHGSVTLEFLGVPPQIRPDRRVCAVSPNASACGTYDTSFVQKQSHVEHTSPAAPLHEPSPYATASRPIAAATCAARNSARASPYSACASEDPL